MKKPHLIITETIGNVPVSGKCSSCPDVTFHTGSSVGKKEEHHEGLQAAFDHHFEVIHLREDASQAAARIVREATE